MPDLTFAVEGAEAVPFCVTPTIGVKLRVANRMEDRVHSVALDCQVRIDAQRRRYDEAERRRLAELFGEPARWSQTLRSLLWTHARASVPPFDDQTTVVLHVPCTADFNVLAAKYFNALDGGVVPVSLLFSGTVFHAGAGGALTVARIPWTAEAAFELPASVWHELLDLYYPNTTWLTLRMDTYERLLAYRARHGLLTWEQTVDALLACSPEGTPQ
ncbi:MAG TPA: DUF6084 family protein [Terriglobales bacterium]|nr:DUF6084 family protein [Terriglobales bacterium]